jgi:hypothetical protein
VRERGGLPRESTHGQSCEGDGSRDTDVDVCDDDEPVSSGTPQASFTSLLDHVSSIGSHSVVLAPRSWGEGGLRATGRTSLATPERRAREMGLFDPGSPSLVSVP